MLTCLFIHWNFYGSSHLHNRIYQSPPFVSFQYTYTVNYWHNWPHSPPVCLPSTLCVTCLVHWSIAARPFIGIPTINTCISNKNKNDWQLWLSDLRISPEIWALLSLVQECHPFKNAGLHLFFTMVSAPRSVSSPFVPGTPAPSLHTWALFHDCSLALSYDITRPCLWS